MDHRRLRHGGGQGGVFGPVRTFLSRSGGNRPARRPKAGFSPGLRTGRRWLGQGRSGQGCRRRSRRHPRRHHRRHRPQGGSRLRHRLSRRSRRRHRHPSRTAPAAGRAGHQPGAAPPDGGPGRGHRPAGRRRRRSGDRDFRSGRRAAGGPDLESQAGHRRRHFHPGDHRGGGALFLLGLDPFDPARHRRGAGLRHRPCRRLRGTHVRDGGARLARPARGCRHRHGRFRRRHAEISAPPSDSPRHHRRRLRQAVQAGGRASGPAFQAVAGRSGRSGRTAAEPGGSGRTGGAGGGGQHRPGCSGTGAGRRLAAGGHGGRRRPGGGAAGPGRRRNRGRGPGLRTPGGTGGRQRPQAGWTAARLVTGMAARQPSKPPSGPAPATDSRLSSPPVRPYRAASTASP